MTTTGVKCWPITMAEASHIARLRPEAGSDKEIADEYGVEEELIHEIRTTKGYRGVRL